MLSAVPYLMIVMFQKKPVWLVAKGKKKRDQLIELRLGPQWTVLELNSGHSLVWASWSTIQQKIVKLDTELEVAQLRMIRETVVKKWNSEDSEET